MKISNWQYSFTNDLYSISPEQNISRPSFFYKYYSFTDYNLKAFVDSKLYFSHPLVLNDIFDGSIQILNLKRLSLSQLVNLYSSNREIVWKENAPDYHSIKDFVEREYRKDKNSLLQLTLTFYWNIIFQKKECFRLLVLTITHYYGLITIVIQALLLNFQICQ